MTKLQLSHEAQNDLAQISEYISKELDNPGAAKRILAQISKRMRMLITFPTLGASLATILPIQTKHRFLVAGSYVVFYRHDEGKNAVFVIRVLYGKRDFSKFFPNELREQEGSEEIS